jgi:hypothetical protein
MQKIFVTPAETVSHDEFGTLRRPKGVADLGVKWIAKDLGTHFLVIAKPETQAEADLFTDSDLIDLDTISDVSNQDLPANVKTAVLNTESEVNDNSINV